MAQSKVIALEQGKQLIQNSAAGLGGYTLHSFIVGSAAGFEPEQSETIVRGDRVFEANVALTQTRLLEDGSVRYTLLIPETAGLFNVGNVVLYASSSGGDPIPLVMMVLPYPVIKRSSEVDITDSNLPYPGNRLLISITLRHIVLDESDENVELTVQVIAPEYANLPYFQDDLNLPDPSINPWQQFILQNLEATNGPALVARRSDDTYHVSPFFRNLRHPLYAVLNGGHEGDGYRESRDNWIWGRRLDTPSESFTHTIGGRPLGSTSSNLNKVGGLPLSSV